MNSARPPAGADDAAAAPGAAARRFGLRQRLLLVLTATLTLMAGVNALLASYYTSRQGREAAYVRLSDELKFWHEDLQALVRQVREVALTTTSDAAMLNDLVQQLTLESAEKGPLDSENPVDRSRPLGYHKAVSLNRLQLTLRSAGLSGIAVYTHGHLSHYVSPTDAGMVLHRQPGAAEWLRTSTPQAAQLNVRDWPDWPHGAALGSAAAPEQIDTAGLEGPQVSFVFDAVHQLRIIVTVPLQGVLSEVMTDDPRAPLLAVYSSLHIAEPGAGAATPQGRPRHLAALVFTKAIDQATLERVVRRSRKQPFIASTDGEQRLGMAGAPAIPAALLRAATADNALEGSLQQDVETPGGSFYLALQPLKFENQTRLVLGLTEGREDTAHNVRQTLVSILLVSLGVLLLSVLLGTWWMRRSLGPIVQLTAAVRVIAAYRKTSAPSGDDRGVAPLSPVLSGDGPLRPASGRADAASRALDALHSVDRLSGDEVGDLARAYSALLAELQQSLETLEQRVQERTAELRQQALYLQTLIDMLPMWAWFKDADSRYRVVNQSFARHHRMEVRELVGRRDDSLRDVQGAGEERADDREVMATGQQRTTEHRVVEGGLEVWMEMYKAAVLDVDGTVLGTVGAARNISERKATEAAREAALNEARRLAQQRSVFLAQMSHELRTPLNGILGFAKLLQEEADITASQQRGLKIIEQCGEHLLALINDVLDLASVDAAKLQLWPRPVAMRHFLQVVTDIVRVKADEKQLRFESETDGPMPAIAVFDEQRLRQVLLNLLSNAIKFSDEGPVRLRVTSEATAPRDAAATPGASLLFEVSDCGIGMTDSQMASLFQPFEQLSDARRRQGGTGLGLAISQQLVRLMGAEISVRSTPGQGSLFSFRIEVPVALADAENGGRKPPDSAADSGDTAAAALPE